MKRTWQLQEAKNKLSEVVERSTVEGPQVITKCGKEVAVLVSPEEYARLTKSKTKLSTFFRQSPLVDLELDLTRDKSPVPDRVKL